MRIAVVIASALIALAILIVFRWQLGAATGVVYRLDRWTGHAVACDMSYRDCQEIQFER
jgi:hypothetical protein